MIMSDQSSSGPNGPAVGVGVLGDEAELDVALAEPFEIAACSRGAAAGWQPAFRQYRTKAAPSTRSTASIFASTMRILPCRLRSRGAVATDAARVWSGGLGRGDAQFPAGG